LLTTIVRGSTSYFSVIAFASKRLFDLPFYAEIYAIPADRFWYRLSLIFTPGTPLDRPDVLSVNRLNLINYLKPTDAYALGAVGGASPGMVATGFYLAPFPIGFVMMAFFVAFIARLMNSAMADKRARGTFLLPLFLLPYFNSVFESPMDLLAIDPSCLFIILLFFACVALRRQASHAEEKSPLPQQAPLEIQFQ